MPYRIIDQFKETMDRDPILAPLIDAFAEVEVKDLRVDRVVLEKQKYIELVTSKEYLDTDLTCTHNEGNYFRLWGVPVILDETVTQDSTVNRVYSEDGFTRSCSVSIEFNPRKIKRQFLKNYYIIVRSRANIIKGVPKNELCAIETLREMITEMEYRRYMTHSFITVSVSNGKIYQIFRNRDHVKIWQQGVLIEELCISLKDSKIPPTDKVIALKTMIEIDEESTRKLGNLYKMDKVAA